MTATGPTRINRLRGADNIRRPRRRGQRGRDAVTRLPSESTPSASSKATGPRRLDTAIGNEPPFGRGHGRRLDVVHSVRFRARCWRPYEVAATRDRRVGGACTRCRKQCAADRWGAHRRLVGVVMARCIRAVTERPGGPACRVIPAHYRLQRCAACGTYRLPREPSRRVLYGARLRASMWQPTHAINDE